MFEPWIGKRYGDETSIVGCRLMIVGESHYTQTADDIGLTPVGFTKHVVLSLGFEKRHKFFNRIMQVVRGHDHRGLTRGDAAEFWDSVSFYNFVPVLVDGRPAEEGGAARRPDHTMFEAGARVFRQIRDHLEPDAIIVCGLTTWDYLAPVLDGFEGKPRDVIFYDDGRSVYARIHHPSYRNFDASYWYKRVHKLIEMTSAPRDRGRKIVWHESLED